MAPTPAQGSAACETWPIEPERKPTVTLPRNQLIALIVGVCVLSAAIGSGIALLAQTGPKGSPGKQGPAGPKGARGPAGPEGESAGEELGGLEGEVEELRGAIEEGGGGDTGELEDRVESLEEEVAELGGLTGEVCEEAGFIC